MENSGGILARVGEHLLKWVGFLAIIALALGIYFMGSSGRAALWAAIWRTTAWLVFVAALPWLSRLFIRRLLEVGSNAAGAGLLAGLIAADILVGALLLTAWPGGFWSWLAAIAAVAVAGAYNYLVAEYLAEQAGG